MNTLTCPYCGHEFENYCTYEKEPGTNYTKECPECGKTFQFSLEYNPYFESWKVPCLNGELHDYKLIYESSQVFECSHCGEQIFEPEMLKYLNSLLECRFLGFIYFPGGTQ